MRNRYSKTEKQEWIQKYQASNLSVKKFSDKYGVNYHSLSAWLHFQKAKPEFSFVPIVKAKPEIPVSKINDNQGYLSIERNITFKFKVKIKISNFLYFQWKSALNKNFL